MSTKFMMPVLFIGHGNPMNAIEETPFVAAWREEAARIPRPEAVLCISAHWQTDGACVTAMERPRTIHDFYGFPKELYRVSYPAPGAPELAEQVRALLGAPEIALDQSWGLDHGSWSLLRRMYPDADIPVVQLSLDRGKSPAEHIELALRLSPLRESGVLVLGSGNLVHNLSLMRWQHDESPYPWAEEFNSLARELITAGELDRLADYPSLGQAAHLSIPTNEHYLPLLYALALRGPEDPVTFFADGIVLASVSMLSVRIG